MVRAEWLARLVHLGPWAIVLLGLSAGVYQPIGPDILVLSSALVGLSPWQAAALAFLSTCGGGMLGYAVGCGLLQSLLKGLLTRRAREVERARHWLTRWGHWFVLLAGISPIPLTQVAWAAGLLRMPLPRFLLAMAGGLLPRFGLEALLSRQLLQWLGAPP
ncbi:MAG: VTT domain-containing protein [candidate division KSB1 bacterium]|nr:VTT domain-containing protein [candidate division KSB1 bacterium]